MFFWTEQKERSLAQSENAISWLAVAHVLSKIAFESCVVNFSCKLWEPVKKRLTSKRCPLGRTLDESSTTRPDQEMELLLYLPAIAQPLFSQLLTLQNLFRSSYKFWIAIFQAQFPPSYSLLQWGKSDFNSQWVKTNIGWTGPQPTNSSAVWLLLKLCNAVLSSSNAWNQNVPSSFPMQFFRTMSTYCKIWIL